MSVTEASRLSPLLKSRRVAATNPPLFLQPMLGEAQCVGRWRGNRIFEDYSAKTYVIAPGGKAIRVAVEGYNHLWDISPNGARKNDSALFANPWASTRPAGDSLLQLRGDVWVLLDQETETPVPVPASMIPVLSNDHKWLLYFENSPVFRTAQPGSDFWIGGHDNMRQLDAGGPVMAACFTPDGGFAFVLARQADGSSRLLQVNPKTGGVKIIATDLDTPPYWPGSVSIGATNSHVYIPAASTRAPDEILRQRPVAARQTKIYRLPVGGGSLELVATSGSEMTDPQVIGQTLYWIKNITLKEVVALPAAGGPLKTVVTGGYIPEWSPEGDRIGYTVGQFRVADWAICLDAYEISVDAELNPIADPVAVVDGSHEDFTHVYSPCGRWIAYHSHRGAQRTIPFYDAATAHDAVFVRAAEDYEAPEIEVSENAWEIFTARWSPDSRQIVYLSWDRQGHPGMMSAFAVDFDPDTGRKLGLRRLKMADGIVNPAWLDFSPDGSQFIIEDNYEIGKRALWVAKTDGSAAQKLHDYAGHSYGGADFTPDGQTIIFSGLDERDLMQLYSIPATGGNVTKLTHDDANVLYPVVSPDGRWIAATRHMTTQELWRADIVG